MANITAKSLEAVQYVQYTFTDTKSEIFKGEPGPYQPQSYNFYANGGAADSRQDVDDTRAGARGEVLDFGYGNTYDPVTQVLTIETPDVEDTRYLNQGNGNPEDWGR
ncbi:MAG: hypothetical protein GY941_19025 [Planctomycetes bacterium]|nr:hypothetical protein [Planctomycetota bacterium]